MNRLLRFALLFGFIALLASGCQKDNIVEIDPIATDNADDDIANTTFAQTVSVVFSTNGNATVDGTTDDFTVTINNNDVTIVYGGDEYVMYELSGTTTDGFFKLYSSRKQGITLNNVSITNPNGAAINVQGPQSDPNKGKRTFIKLIGDNHLADGTSYTDTPSTEDEKAAMFGEGQFIFSGEGSLNVVATGKSGIVSDDYLHFRSGTISVTSSAGHGMRGQDYILVSDGTLDVGTSANMKKGLSTDGYVIIDGGTTTISVAGGTAYDDEDGEYTGSAGIKADGYFKINDGVLNITNTGMGGKGISCDGNGYFAGGTVNVTVTGSNYGSNGGGGFPGGGNNSSSESVSTKGIKCDGNLLFTGGYIEVNCASHEAIEAKGSITITGGEVQAISQADDAINSGSDFTISGGYVYGFSAGNDGLDANGNFYLKGGVVFATASGSPEVAIDANTEGGYKLYLTGGTLIAIGGLESGSSLSQSCYSAASWTRNTWYALTVDGTTWAFMTPSSGGTPLVISGASTPVLQSGVSTSNGTSHLGGLIFESPYITGGTTVSLSSYTGGNGGGGGPGGGGGHGPF